MYMCVCERETGWLIPSGSLLLKWLQRQARVRPQQEASTGSPNQVMGPKYLSHLLLLLLRPLIGSWIRSGADETQTSACMGC